MDTNLPISQLDPLGNGVYSGSENIFSHFLGPLPKQDRFDGYAQRNVSVWNMPENYKGTSLTLRDTVEDLAFTAYQTYMTTYILPTFLTDQINMSWETFEANAHLMDITPYQTSSHAVTSKRKIGKAQLVRHGIMAEFELDFMRTVMGRAMFVSSINQISRSFLETANAEGVRTLTHSHHNQVQWLREAGLSADQIFKRYLEEDKERFAIVQKSKNGLEKLDMLITKEMEMYRGEADVFLIPEEIAIFATIVPPEKTDYYLAGPRGPDNVNKTGASNRNGTKLDPSQSLHAVRNTPVFIVKNLMVENVSEAESQQLSRYRQIGEYVTMLDDCIDYKNYKTDHRAILMYNQEIDDMTKITLDDCIEHCGLWEEDGSLRPAGYDVRNKSDFEDDFLSFLSPDDGTKTRFRPVEYIFDMAKEYLSTKKLIGAAESLMASVLKKRGIAAPSVFDVGNNLVDINQYSLIASTLKSIIGEDSYLAKFPDDAEIELASLSLKNIAPVVDRERGDSQDSTSMDPIVRNAENARKGIYIGTHLDDGFNKRLLSHVPREKVDEVNAILTGPGSTLQKGEQVRNKLVEYVSSNVPGMKFKDEAPLHKWYDDGVKRYKELKAQEGGGGASGDKVVGYMKRGLDLSGTPYRYLYPQSATSATSHVDALLPMHIANCKAEASASRSFDAGESMHSSGRDMGLAGIGQFIKDSRTDRRKDNTGFDANRYVTLTNHLVALEASPASELVKFAARAYLFIKMNKDSIVRLAANDVVVPMNFLIFRPHMQYRTRAIIKCKQNGGTGVTAVGHSNMMIESTATTKMARMHYTVHMRSIIVYPKNVYVQPDVYVQESAGGAGCRFYDEQSYRALNNDNLENSLLCIAVPITETIFPSPLDISGRFTTSAGQNIGVRGRDERLHYSSAARYNALYDFMRSARSGLDMPTMTVGRSHLNRICYQGHQQNWNANKSEFSRITPSRGHFGKNGSYAGAASVRNGALEQFEKQNYATKPSF